MSKIKIRNFGPIRNDSDWVDIKKVTVFIGNQGSGKSTVAKLISTFSWIEKALTRGDYNEKHFQRKGTLKNQYLSYHRIENYFTYSDKQQSTEIDYVGDAYHIKYSNGNCKITKTNNGEYNLPQIMYVPAERNFISNVKKAKALKLVSDSLVEFVTEFDNAKNDMKGAVQLPVNNINVEYDRLNDTVNLKGKDYKLKLTEASSGLQSLVPLYMVSEYLANSIRSMNGKKVVTSSEERERFRKDVEAIWTDKNLNDEQKRIAISTLSKKFNKSAFINIIEEPEQNLFPSSQWELLKKLLEFNNYNIPNKLILTTHSPYLVNYLSIAIQAEYIWEKIKNDEKASELRTGLENIIPQKSLIKSSDVIVYQIDEKEGIIRELPNPEGIPSDNNFLNNSLIESNDMFDKLLEIQQRYEFFQT